MISESGIIPFVQPIDPSIHPCYICNKPSNGNIGSLLDPCWLAWVCSDCYYNVLKMRPLIEIAEESMKCHQQSID